MVGRNDKGLIMSVVPDGGIYTFIIQNAILKTAEYVRRNKLAYSDHDQQRLLDFITRGYDPGETNDSVCGDAVTRTPRTTTPRDDIRPKARADSTPSDLPDVSASDEQGVEGGRTKKGKEVRQRKTKGGHGGTTQ